MPLLNEHKQVIVAAHRGYRSEYPENTLLAFWEAIKRNVDMIELDLQLTKDGHVIIMHDLTVDRTTDGCGAVGGFMLSEIKQFDAGIKKNIVFSGIKVPTFDEFLDLTAACPDLKYNIEIKDRRTECVDAVMQICTRRNIIEKSVFTCFDAEIIGYMYDKYAVKTQGFPKEKMHNFQDGKNGTYSKMYAVGISMDLLTAELVTEFKKNGIETWSYCPDTVADLEKSDQCGITLVTVNDILPALHRYKKK